MKFFIRVAALVSLFMATSTTAWSSDEHCGWGEVQATFQAFPVGYTQVTDYWTKEVLAGLGGGVERCQFRVFLDGWTFTFNQGDLVLGGVVYLFDYPNWAFTLEEAKDDIKAIEDRVWFGPTGGPYVERELKRTNFKQYNDPALGLTLYQQRAFLMQLAPGEYDSYWEATYYGSPFASALVHIVVLPNP